MALLKRRRRRRDNDGESSVSVDDRRERRRKQREALLHILVPMQLKDWKVAITIGLGVVLVLWITLRRTAKSIIGK